MQLGLKKMKKISETADTQNMLVLPDRNKCLYLVPSLLGPSQGFVPHPPLSKLVTCNRGPETMVLPTVLHHLPPAAL